MQLRGSILELTPQAKCGKGHLNTKMSAAHVNRLSGYGYIAPGRVSWV